MKDELRELEILEEKIKLASSMQEKIDIKDRIIEIKMKLNQLTLPTDSEIECVGCGS